VEVLVSWIESTFGGLLNWISDGLDFMITVLRDALLILPPPVFVILAAVAIWFVARRNTKLAVGSVIGLLLVWDLQLWDLAMETLALVIASTLLALLIGIPTGIMAARSETVNRAIKPVLDLMQTMPAFVYLIPAVIFFGLGNVPGMIATVVFAMPPVIRLTALGILQVPGDLIELAEAERLRDKMLFICGGPRISHELAIELGYDAGFGTGTYSTDVASYIAVTMAERLARKAR